MTTESHHPSDGRREAGQLYAPNGRRINAAQDSVPGNALIAGAVRDREGKLEIDWTGETRLCWDGQHTEETNGERVFLDEDGNAWRESLLSLGTEPLRQMTSEKNDDPWAAIPHGTSGMVPETLPDEDPAVHRRIIAKRALLAAYKDGRDPGPSITDLLGDLRHLCDALGYDFASLDRAGARRYLAEKAVRF